MEQTAHLRIARSPAGYRVVDASDPGRRITVFEGSQSECNQFIGAWLIGQADQVKADHEG